MRSPALSSSRRTLLPCGLLLFFGAALAPTACRPDAPDRFACQDHQDEFAAISFGSDRGPWPSLGGGPARRWATADWGPGAGELAWSTTTNGLTAEAVVYKDGALAATTAEGLRSWDATGSPRWSAVLGSPVSAPVLGSDGSLWVVAVGDPTWPADKGKPPALLRLLAVGSDGSVLWQEPVPQAWLDPKNWAGDVSVGLEGIQWRGEPLLVMRTWSHVAMGRPGCSLGDWPAPVAIREACPPYGFGWGPVGYRVQNLAVSEPDGRSVLASCDRRLRWLSPEGKVEIAFEDTLSTWGAFVGGIALGTGSGAVFWLHQFDACDGLSSLAGGPVAGCGNYGVRLAFALTPADAVLWSCWSQVGLAPLVAGRYQRAGRRPGAWEKTLPVAEECGHTYNSGPHQSQPVLDGAGHAYLPMGQCVVALDVQSGDMLWTRPAHVGRVSTLLLGRPGELYVLGDKGVAMIR